MKFRYSPEHIAEKKPEFMTTRIVESKVVDVKFRSLLKKRAVENAGYILCIHKLFSPFHFVLSPEYQRYFSAKNAASFQLIRHFKTGQFYN